MTCGAGPYTSAKPLIVPRGPLIPPIVARRWDVAGERVAVALGEGWWIDDVFPPVCRRPGAGELHQSRGVAGTRASAAVLALVRLEGDFPERRGSAGQAQPVDRGPGHLCRDWS